MRGFGGFLTNLVIFNFSNGGLRSREESSPQDIQLTLQIIYFLKK